MKSGFFLTVFLFFVFFPFVILAETYHDNTNYNDGSFGWYASGNPHIVIGSVSINSNAGLTIEDGCIVQFENGASITTYGNLTAIGSSGTGISFTRRDTDDQWYGLRFQSGSTGSLQYCTIEYATYSTAFGIYCTNSTPSIGNCLIRNNDYGIYYTNTTNPTLSVNNIIQDNDVGLYFTNSVEPSISNQTITGSSSIQGAVYMYDTDEFHLGSGNSITGNSWGLTMDIGSYPDTASYGNIPMAGNTNEDGMQVYGGSTYGSIYWHDVASDFIVTSTPNINSGGTLTIDDNVNVRFENSQSFHVYGSMQAIGSAARNGILFSRRDTDDQWYGLRFQSGSTGSLQYCTIEYATYSTAFGIYCTNSTPSIGNCLIRNNDYGIYYINTTNPTLSVNNIIQDNDVGLYFTNSVEPSISNQTITGSSSIQGAVYMYNTDEFHLGSGNSITGNTWGLTMDIGSYPDTASYGNIPMAGNTNEDGMQVYGGSTNDSIYWHDVASDFIVTSTPNINSGGNLTIDDNVNVRFENSQSFHVYGSMQAIGSAARNGILFSRRDADDQWYGLRFQSGSTGSLQYCTIEYATYSTAYGIYCTNSTPSIGNCLIRNNDYGIYYINTTNPTLSVNNIIQDNDVGLYFTNSVEPSISNQTITGSSSIQGAVYMYNTDEFHLGSGNSITGNSWGLTMDIGSYPDTASYGNIPMAGNTNEDGMQVYGGSTNDSIYWHDVASDFIVTSTPNINSGGNLTIDDNVNVRFENSQSFHVYGSMQAIGSAARNGILFSRRDADDQWYGLRFQSGSTGSLQYCTIEYATYSTAYGIYCTNSTPSIGNCLIRNNDYGIYYINTTNPTLSVNNIIQDNDVGLYFTNSVEPSISNQTITGSSSIQGAVYMYNTDEFHLGSGNSITGNTWGLTMDIGSYPDTASYGNIPMAGNTNEDGMQVYGGSTSDSIYWHDVASDFIVTSTPNINSGGNLTIDDNVNVRFENSQSFYVYGSMQAIGSAARNGILFSRRDADDQWYGLRFQSGSTGSLQYCTIEYATYSTAYGIYCTNSTPSIGNCLIRNNDYGIYYINTTNPTLSVNNIIQDNDVGLYFTNSVEPSISNQTITGSSSIQGAVYMYNTDEFHLGSGNSITGNSWGLTMDIGSYPDTASYGNIPMAGNTNEDGMQVYGGSTSDSIYWHDVASDFIVTSTPNINSGGNLTIDDNVNVRFENSQSFHVYGSMQAIGSAARNGILFSRRDADDQWYGLRFQSGSTGSLQYCTIEYATYSTAYGIYTISPISIQIDHCTLQYNDYGFYGIDASPNFLSNNRMINNGFNGVHLNGDCTPIFGSELAEWNDIYGNGSYGLKNGDNDITVGYVYWGTEFYNEIEDLIYHVVDDTSLGLVTFFPYTNAPHDTEFGEPLMTPENLMITVIDDIVYLTWDPVETATSYKVYSSDYSNSDFSEDNTGVFLGESWSTPVIYRKNFYIVTAIRE